MAMPYIIDGHNLIGKLKSIDLNDPDDEKMLIRLLSTFMIENDKHGIVFFDQAAFGGTQRGEIGRLEVRFIRPPQNADRAIQNYLGGIKSQAANYIVVSSDHQVRDAAMRFGARWMKSEEFAARLTHDEVRTESEEKPKAQLSSDEIEDWERLFKNQNGDKSNL